MAAEIAAAGIQSGGNLLASLLQSWAAQKQKNQEMEQQAELARAQTLQNLGQQQAGTLSQLMQNYKAIL